MEKFTQELADGEIIQLVDKTGGKEWEAETAQGFEPTPPEVPFCDTEGLSLIAQEQARVALAGLQCVRLPVEINNSSNLS